MIVLQIEALLVVIGVTFFVGVLMGRKWTKKKQNKED